MKVKIKVILNSNTSNVNKELMAIKINNNISYNDDNCLTKLFLDDKKLIRENDNFKLIIDFNNQVCYYFLKCINKELSLPINIASLVQKDNSFKVVYFIENEKINYEMKVL